MDLDEVVVQTTLPLRSENRLLGDLLAAVGQFADWRTLLKTGVSDISGGD